MMAPSHSTEDATNLEEELDVLNSKFTKNGTGRKEKRVLVGMKGRWMLVFEL